MLSASDAEKLEIPLGLYISNDEPLEEVIALATTGTVLCSSRTTLSTVREDQDCSVREAGYEQERLQALRLVRLILFAVVCN